MPKKLKSTVSNIKGYDIKYEMSQGSSLGDVITYAKKAAKLANNRLYKLEKAGLTSAATTGGIKHIDLKNIVDEKTTARALSKARSLLVNPLSTPGQVHALYKEAVQEYGQAGRMKFIAVEVKVKGKDAQGNEVERIKLIPKAVPYGTNKDSMKWTEVSKALKDFWTWFDKLGQNYFTSEESYNIWVQSEYDSRTALKMAEKDISDRGTAIKQEYNDTKTTLYGVSKPM